MDRRKGGTTTYGALEDSTESGVGQCGERAVETHAPPVGETTEKELGQQ